MSVAIGDQAPDFELKDQTGKLVAKAKGITVVRNPDAAKK